MPQARILFRRVQKQTKRRPYIRSKYFAKEKVFFDYFWMHLQKKSLPDRARRLRFFPCALELIRHSRQQPVKFVDVQQPDQVKYQFLGEADASFSVVVLQEKRGRKQLLTMYPNRLEA